MPFRMEESGYNVDRFQSLVRPDALCSICRNVPKDVRLCQNHDHLFCLAHVSESLQRCKKCPVCREELTLETLRRPTEFIKNYLDDLIIRCDYHSRGCPEQIRLESLQNHVDQCGFAPARCENERCRMEINKRDKEDHEKDFCQFRFAKCHDCRDIKVSQDQLNARLDQIQGDQDVIMSQLNEIMASEEDKGSIQDAMKENKDEIMAILQQLRDKMNAREEQMRANQNEIKATLDEMRVIQNKANSTQEQMKASQNEMNAWLEHMRENSNKINFRFGKIRASQNEMNARLKQMRANQNEVNAQKEQIIASQNEMNARLEQVRASQDEMNVRHAQIRVSQNEMNARLKQTKAYQDGELKKVKDSVTGVKRKQGEVAVTVKKLKNDVENIRNQGEMRAMMNRQRMMGQPVWQESEGEDDEMR